MKYSVVNVRCSPPKVLLTYPFKWMATVMAKVYGGDARGFETAATPTDAQTVINICVQRDTAVDQRETVAADRVELVNGLWGLVARDDNGKWTTVHEPDTEIPAELGALLDRVLA